MSFIKGVKTLGDLRLIWWPFRKVVAAASRVAGIVIANTAPAKIELPMKAVTLEVPPPVDSAMFKKS